MYIKNKKGQSTVEYILLVTAVVAVMIVFATSKSGPLQTQLNNALTTVTSDMNSEANKLESSHSSPEGGNGTPDYNINVDPTP